MISQKSGSIINTASISAHIVNYPQQQCAYNASKAGVVHLTKSLAVEWAPHNILETPLTATLPEQWKHAWMQQSNMKRFGIPSDLTAAVVYLACDAASFTTGMDMIYRWRLYMPVMRCAQIDSPQHITIRQVPIPPVGHHDIRIQVHASGICGTDIHIYQREYIGEFPIIPGHEFSGIVVEIGNAIQRIHKGDRVAVEPNIACNNCWYCLHNKQHMCEHWQAVGVTRFGGMEEYAVVPETAVFPTNDMPFEHTAFMEPLSCVLHGIELARLRMGSRVLLTGAGPIGMLLLRTLHNNGIRTIDVVETHGGRRTTASNEGAQTFQSLEELPKQSYDVAIDATGVPAVETQLPYYVRPTGTILFFGVPPQHSRIEIEPFYFFKNELALLASFTSLKNSYQALHMIATKAIRADDLISHTIPLDNSKNERKYNR